MYGGSCFTYASIKNTSIPVVSNSVSKSSCANNGSEAAVKRINIKSSFFIDFNCLFKIVVKLVKGFDLFRLIIAAQPHIRKIDFVINIDCFNIAFNKSEFFK